MATVQAFSFPSNQYCNEKHPVALRNNREEAGDMLKERHMDPVSISTHGVSFCLLLCPLLTTSFLQCIRGSSHTHTYTHTRAPLHAPLRHRWPTTLGLSGQTDKRNERNGVLIEVFNTHLKRILSLAPRLSI